MLQSQIPLMHEIELIPEKYGEDVVSELKIFQLKAFSEKGRRMFYGGRDYSFRSCIYVRVETKDGKGVLTRRFRAPRSVFRVKVVKDLKRFL